jgi:hypothetical protein
VLDSTALNDSGGIFLFKEDFSGEPKKEKTHMKISLEETRSLLNKWKGELSLVHVVFAYALPDGSGASFGLKRYLDWGRVDIFDAG